MVLNFRCYLTDVTIFTHKFISSLNVIRNEENVLQIIRRSIIRMLDNYSYVFAIYPDTKWVSRNTSKISKYFVSNNVL